MAGRSPLGAGQRSAAAPAAGGRRRSAARTEPRAPRTARGGCKPAAESETASRYYLSGACLGRLAFHQSEVGAGHRRPGPTHLAQLHHDVHQAQQLLLRQRAGPAALRDVHLAPRSQNLVKKHQYSGKNRQLYPSQKLESAHLERQPVANHAVQCPLAARELAVDHHLLLRGGGARRRLRGAGD